jgi:hypothetical protein
MWSWHWSPLTQTSLLLSPSDELASFLETTLANLKEVTGQIISVVWHYCQRFSLRCWGKVFQWLPKDWHKKVSDFCKMKFVHVHFAADWMNKFPNRGRYQIANIISWQNSLYCSQLSTSSHRHSWHGPVGPPPFFCYFNKVRYFFRMNNQLTLPRTERLLCLPFERRETYCFSLIFSSASASSQRSLSGP